MHVGTETAIIAPLILILSWAPISIGNILTDIPKKNPLNIDWYPAPAPENGPPLSANASRDPALLPAQIGAIVGSYLFSVCIVGSALILIGRRLRFRSQSGARALDIEMVEPHFPTFDPSPISPGQLPGGPRNFSWPSPEKDIRNPYIFPPSTTTINGSPISPVGVDSSFDTRIIDADRDMLQRDLEDIYAHVMQQEDAKAAGINVKEMPLPPQLQHVGPVPTEGPQRQSSLPKEKKLEKAPSRRPSTLTLDEGKSEKSHSRSSSILSALRSPRRKKMQISSPIPTPLSTTFPNNDSASDEEPLTPRYHPTGPPPPVPKDQVPYNPPSRKPSVIIPSSPSAQHSIAEQLNNNNPYGQFLPQSRHRTNISHASVQSSSSQSNDPASAVSTTSTTPFMPPPERPMPPPERPTLAPIGIPRQSTSHPPSNNSSVRALPFRQFEPALASPSFSHSTKTTVLERSPQLGGGPNTAGLKTPWSAGAVPYSPYQPFTPMVPITPRLVTKEDRKKMKKMQGRAPALEMVASDDELWDSGY
jgi:hypothetical protein